LYAYIHTLFYMARKSVQVDEITTLNESWHKRSPAVQDDETTLTKAMPTETRQAESSNTAATSSQTESNGGIVS